MPCCSKLDIDEIRQKYDMGGYTHKVDIPRKVSEDFVFDEELSVKRNRELVAEHNAKVAAVREEARLKQLELDKQLTNDVVEYIMAYYGLNEHQARLVESFVYREHHAFMWDYFSYIDTYADFAYEIINIKEN